MAYVKTPKYGFETPDSTQLDDVPNDLKKVVTQIEELIDGLPVAELEHGTEKQLLVVQATGAVAYKALSGDATIATTGALTISNNAITAAKIAAEAVEAAKLAANAVVTAKIAGEAVTEAKLANLAVAAAKLAAEAVETAKIKNEAVTAAKLAALAVETAKVKDEAITTVKIANEGVTTAKLANGAVTSPKLKPTIVEKLPTETNFATTETMTLIPGLKYEVTPEVASNLLVHAWVRVQPGATSSTTTEWNIYLDGVAQMANNITFLEKVTEPTARQMGITKLLTLTAAAHTIEIRAKNNTGLVSNITKQGTAMVCQLMAS